MTADIRPAPGTRAGLFHARTAGALLSLVAITAWWSTSASAQLDPLLFLKRVPPTVIVAFDNSFAMMEDGDGNFYDSRTYTVTDDAAAATAMGIDTAVARTYRRKYVGLQYEALQDTSRKWETSSIVAVPDTAAQYGTFWNSTRFEIAKRGLTLAIERNSGSTFRWGLVKQRQDNPAWPPNCDKPVRVTGAAAPATLLAGSDGSPCAAGGASRYGIFAPAVANPNYGIESAGAAVVQAAGGRASLVAAKIAPWRPEGAAAPTSYSSVTGGTGIIPASRGERGVRDRPLSHLLDDTRAEVVRAMAADAPATRSCRNTVVVLVVSGPESGSTTYMSAHTAATVASTFASVTTNGVTRRVPIHVIGVKVSSTEADSLRPIATNSGGTYTSVTSAYEVARAVNYAVQAGFSRPTDFQTSTPSVFLPVSPVIGTVNLVDGVDATGAALDHDVVHLNNDPAKDILSQRSNVLLSTGFSLPGFQGVLRAFRSYRPEEDSSKPTGWKFTSDGTKLWPDLDGRPSLAGQARVPADPNTRNIHTYIPDGSGGGSVVAFTAANEAQLRTPLGVADATTATSLIALVRAQPLGAIVGSTPALMDPPSLDPPPDDAYGRGSVATSFAGAHKDRRSLIFVGANDGMIHAIDARTGYEVWAFIPYNLLPKLRTLREGQPVEQFDYFVDSSPKIAEVKIGAAWRSLLIIGEGPGGTFYQAFDVTEAGMGVAPTLDDATAVTSLLGLFDAPDESIQFKWAFPNYSSFDPTYTAVLAVTDGTPGGQFRVFGDLKSTATYAEKTVGFTWSDPAVGSVTGNRSTTAVIVGSGYFPDKEAALPGRGAAAPKAGNALYMLNVDTGALIGNPSGATCPVISSGSGTGLGCASVGDVAANGRKNALQADPTAAGDNGSIVVNKAFLGDIDGKYWRFGLTPAGEITARLMRDTAQPIYASSALLFIGSADVYMFFATGSDLLASSAPGGSGTFKLYGLKDNHPATGAAQMFARDLAPVPGTSARAGERPSTSPSVAGDIVFYTTTIESPTDLCTDFSAKLYALTYAGGPAYDSDNSGRVTSTDVVVATVAGRATAPFIVDQHLYLGAGGATGANIEAFGDPDDFNNGIGQVGVRVLSWREIR